MARQLGNQTSSGRFSHILIAIFVLFQLKQCCEIINSLPPFKKFETFLNLFSVFQIQFENEDLFFKPVSADCKVGFHICFVESYF